MDSKELHAMIRLLDDPDEHVFDHVRSKLLSLGSDVVEILENEWEKADDALSQKRIENIIHSIQYSKCLKALRKWVKGGGEDLLEGVILIARYHYPELDEVTIHDEIERLRHEIWLEISPRLTALEKARVINHVMFDVSGYQGNNEHFHAPQNSYINNVIDSRKGNPLSLSILYLIVCQKLEMPVYGINLPERFILAYMNDDGIEPNLHEEGASEVLFYINPFNKGSMFGKSDIDDFLKQVGVKPHRSFYEPCTNLDMLRRIANNLVNAYEQEGDAEKVEEVKLIQRVLLGEA